MFAARPAGDLTKMSAAEASLAADLWQRGEPREALEHALTAVKYDEKNADAAHITALLYLDFCRTSQIG
jgi:Tfp pilus assembly protein PilF